MLSLICIKTHEDEDYSTERRLEQYLKELIMRKFTKYVKPKKDAPHEGWMLIEEALTKKNPKNNYIK